VPAKNLSGTDIQARCICGGRGDLYGGKTLSEPDGTQYNDLTLWAITPLGRLTQE